MLRCSSKRTVVVRASDDFYSRDPLAVLAPNNVLWGEFIMQPDWDILDSLHPASYRVSCFH
ncbi:hypothetical protein NC652_031976 [Populus alba x Populus x berolinensis]|nr:hypothetical protein NC652_031976 [Populus alba x Populus x berolinensis]